ncbi:MAG: hypothetical protein K2G93_07475 [Rikenella sp.]|nr:hypothetical protein [Rikenella sp.]
MKATYIIIPTLLALVLLGTACKVDVTLKLTLEDGTVLLTNPLPGLLDA